MAKGKPKAHRDIYISQFARMDQTTLRENVNRMVNDVNQRMVEYNAGDGDMDIFRNLYGELQRQGGKGKGGGLAKGYKLRKSELVAYAEMLNRAQQWDIFTEKGVEQRKAREQKAWRTFKRRHPNWTKAEWRNVGEYMSTVGSSLIEIVYGDDANKDDFMEDIRRAQKEGVSADKFGDIVKQAYNNGGDQMDMHDFIRDALRG